MTSYGYTLISPQETDLAYRSNSNSIYHYHGSCEMGSVVDNNLKVNNINNVYIGDISVLDNMGWFNQCSGVGNRI